MGQDLQAHDRKWLEGLARKQGTRSLETITETISFRNGNRTRDLWKSTRIPLPSLAVQRRAEDVQYRQMHYTPRPQKASSPAEALCCEHALSLGVTTSALVAPAFAAGRGRCGPGLSPSGLVSGGSTASGLAL